MLMSEVLLLDPAVERMERWHDGAADVLMWNEFDVHDHQTFADSQQDEGHGKYLTRFSILRLSITDGY